MTIFARNYNLSSNAECSPFSHSILARFNNSLIIYITYNIALVLYPANLCHCWLHIILYGRVSRIENEQNKPGEYGRDHTRFFISYVYENVTNCTNSS